MNKQAQIGDMMFVIVTIASIALTMLIAAFVYQELKTPINNNDLATNESIAAYNAFGTAFPMLDAGMLFIVIALIIGLLVSALFIPSSPVFLVVNIVGMLALVYLGGTFANLYGAMLEQTGENTTMALIASTNYPITSFILKYLPYIGFVVILLVTIIMYGKSTRETF